MGLEILAIVIVAFTAIDTVSLLVDVGERRFPVSFDSGRAYLALMLVFPWLHLCGALSRKNVPLRRLSQLTVVFFFGLIILAWGSTRYIERKLEATGYVACAGEKQYRVSPGQSRIYTLRSGGCGEALQE